MFIGSMICVFIYYKFRFSLETKPGFLMTFLNRFKQKKGWFKTIEPTFFKNLICYSIINFLVKLKSLVVIFTMYKPGVNLLVFIFVSLPL